MEVTQQPFEHATRQINPKRVAAAASALRIIGAIVIFLFKAAREAQDQQPVEQQVPATRQKNPKRVAAGKAATRHREYNRLLTAC